MVGCWNSNKPLGNLSTKWMYTHSLKELYPMEFNLWIYNVFLTPGNRLITSFKLSLQMCFYQHALMCQLLNKTQFGEGWQNCVTCKAHTDFQHYKWYDIYGPCGLKWLIQIFTFLMFVFLNGKFPCRIWIDKWQQSAAVMPWWIVREVGHYFLARIFKFICSTNMWPFHHKTTIIPTMNWKNIFSYWDISLSQDWMQWNHHESL